MEKIFAEKDLTLIHKLNNHLFCVIGYGQLVLHRIVDPEAKKDLTMMIDEAKQASQASKDLENLLKEGKKISEWNVGQV